MAKRKAAVNGHDNERGENGEGEEGGNVSIVCRGVYVCGWMGL